MSCILSVQLDNEAELRVEVFLPWKEIQCEVISTKYEVSAQSYTPSSDFLVTNGWVYWLHVGHVFFVCLLSGKAVLEA